MKVLAVAGAKLRRKTMMYSPIGSSSNLDPYMCGGALGMGE